VTLINFVLSSEQIKKAGLSCFNNQWNLVYDFTPVPSEGLNWSLINSDNLKDIFLGFGELRQESTYRYMHVITFTFIYILYTYCVIYSCVFILFKVTESNN
jgi:hypothetical protein